MPRLTLTDADAGAVEFPRVEYPPRATVLDLFHDRVAETPDRPAIVFGDTVLTYRQVDGKAAALAARLAAAGVRRGDLIPLLVGNEPLLPVSAIALMKLAAPFVPVDEAWPAARIAAVLDQLDPAVVVCSPGLADLAATVAGGRATVAVDLAALPQDAPPVAGPGPGRDDLIYGFFTSGSTGLPKCALNAHLGLLNRFLTMTRRFAGDGAVVLQNSRHVFDSSIWQLFWPLTTGSTVVIPVRHGILDLAETVNVIARNGVTMTDFVPSIFNTLVTMVADDPRLRADLGSLRRVLIGGEEVSATAVRRFRALMPQVGLTNTYGPTECSIGSVFHEIDDADEIPIGRAIDNTVALVLDEQLRPLPPGVQGEIHIGGDCVGRGYLGDREKTAAAFLPNPFRTVPGPLIYRTGDLGWLGEDGLLRFAGRRDHQVKLNGVRIELTEVEAALTRHPGVREAKAVIAGEGSRQRLVAFVLLAEPVPAGRLREYVAGLLPGEAVPKEVVELPAFPLTPNGKADRRALAALAASGVAPQQVTEPATELERRILAVWRQVLDLPAVGTTTSFFDAGGDSLAAQRLAVALRAVLGRSPGVRELVSHPTVRAQVALVREADAAGEEPVIGRLRADSVLPADLRRAADEPWRLDTVLLTGATGFVGAHLLHELLARTPARVVCLVRAADRREARERVDAVLARYGLAEDTATHRMDVLPGDLGTARFGLAPEAFAALADEVDTVVHSGAMVNLLLDYEAHRPANVEGTGEILRLIATGRRKHLHHISTLGIFPAGALNGDRIAEEVEPLENSLPSHGYGQSKWVSERLVLAARERGVESSVYRLGEVGPHSGTGVPSDRGLVDRLLLAAAAHGVYPGTSVAIDYTPVDYVARLVVAAVARGRVGDTYHPVQRTAVGLDDLFHALARRSKVDRVSYRAFWRSLDRTDEAALRLRTMLPEPVGDPAADARCLADVFSNASHRFVSQRADRLCAEAGIVLPPREAVLGRYAQGCLQHVGAHRPDTRPLPLAQGRGVR
ncbi:non-ribosomal peptide synthetase [Kitasatospora sp. NPDC094015]|uniref:non-ribosomal peptide synthetase n=1 Tax=Kitasatospora sp. NPDC094015 TaxID=3155205 RepID=UPI00332574C4